MSEAPVTQEPSTEQAPSTEAPASPSQSLEDVFKSYQVEHQPPEQNQNVPVSQPQQQYQPRPEAPHIPDPALDPDGFRRYEASRHADSQVLRQAVLQIAGQLNQHQTAAVKQREEADIAKAVGVLTEKVPGVDPEVLEVYLGAQAKKDPRLLQVWNNRDKNPKAWNAALEAIGSQAASKFEIRTDPQLVENQRAIKASQQAMATAQPQPSREEQIGKMQGAEFDREWERLKAG
jgi:hypothetical protein